MGLFADFSEILTLDDNSWTQSGMDNKKARVNPWPQLSLIYQINNEFLELENIWFLNFPLLLSIASFLQFLLHGFSRQLLAWNPVFIFIVREFMILFTGYAVS